MLFGIPIALFPAVADRYGGPELLGLLYAAEPGRRACCSRWSSGWVARVPRHGTAIALSAAAYGARDRRFGLAGPLPLALLALAAAGAADMSSGIFRATLWNQTIPDAMRGRMAGIEQLSYSIGPTLGTTRSGARRVGHERPRSRSPPAASCARRHRVLCALLPRFWRLRRADGAQVSA